MAEMKTRPTEADVDAFIAHVEPERRRDEARQIRELMERVSGEPAVMWGDSIIGFGRYAYTYKSGRSGEFMRAGFSPRKTAMTIYIMPGFDECADLLARLGPHKLGRSCLYIKRLDQVDIGVLEELIRFDLAEMAKRYPE